MTRLKVDGITILSDVPLDRQLVDAAIEIGQLENIDNQSRVEKIRDKTLREFCASIRREQARLSMDFARMCFALTIDAQDAALQSIHQQARELLQRADSVWLHKRDSVAPPVATGGAT